MKSKRGGITKPRCFFLPISRFSCGDNRTAILKRSLIQGPRGKSYIRVKFHPSVKKKKYSLVKITFLGKDQNGWGSFFKMDNFSKYESGK